jgi:predicted amidohydrolase
MTTQLCFATVARMKPRPHFVLLLTLLFLAGAARHQACGAAAWLDGWTTGTARAEIAPLFTVDPFGGSNRQGALTIRAGRHEGTAGWWTRTFPVVGGRSYRFSALRRTENVPRPAWSAFARVLWLDANGRAAMRDVAESATLLPGRRVPAEPEFPRDHATGGGGWTEVSDTYLAPSNATAAVIELHLRWAPPKARVAWAAVSFAEAPAPEPRIARLSTVHFFPSGGKTPEGNRRLFVPLIAEAARQRADLIVLGETVTRAGTGLSFEQTAEAVPGPSTEFFGSLAKKHDTHIVVPVVEREGRLLYNTAALVGPDGRMIGKYRKAVLPGNEWDKGLQPGMEYPVFDTRFGRVGIMICFDGFFPEVARRLAASGAEVIAFPVWGCNPRLAAARAIENHVYVVSSTYSEPGMNWMPSGIYDHEGTLIGQAEKFGTVAVAEVDLNRRVRWPWLGDFKAEWPRHVPPAPVRSE